MKTILILVSIATSALSQGLYFGSSVVAATTNNWVAGGVPTGVSQANPTSVTTGCKFTPSVNMTVTDLGWWLVSTSDADICISLFSDAGTQLATGTITSSTGVAGAFNYVHLSPAVALTAGVAYRISGALAAGTSHYYDDTGAAPTVTGDAALNSSCYANLGTCATAPSTLHTAGVMYGPIDFKYTKP